MSSIKQVMLSKTHLPKALPESEVFYDTETVCAPECTEIVDDTADAASPGNLHTSIY